MLAIATDPQSYIAHRTLLGIRKAVGVRTCHAIAEAVIANHRNFRDLFYGPIPDRLLSPRQLKAVRDAAEICADVAMWDNAECLSDRVDELCAHVVAIRGDDPGVADDLRAFLSELPGDMTLEETLLYLGADRDDDRRKVLDAYVVRTGSALNPDELVPDRVRIMTMHSAKGLSASIVFIPALDDELLPGAKRARYPGQVLEAARMLYVAITRARVACIVSYADKRFGFGYLEPATPSRFATRLGGKFAPRSAGISDAGAAAVAEASQRL